MAIQIVRGQSKIVTIPVLRYFGFDNDIVLSVSTPPGFSATLSLTTLNKTQTATQMEVTAGSEVPSGVSEIIILGVPSAKGGALSVPIEVVETTQAPFIASTDFTYENTYGRVFTFIPTATYPPASNVSMYTWDFGNGSTASTVEDSPNVNVNVPYAQNGTYTVTLVTTFSNNTSITVSKIVVVDYVDPPPILRPRFITKTLKISRIMKAYVLDDSFQRIREAAQPSAGYNPGIVVEQGIPTEAGSTIAVSEYVLDTSFAKCYIEFENLVDIPTGYELYATNLKTKIANFTPLYRLSTSAEAAFVNQHPATDYEVYVVRSQGGTPPSVFHQGFKPTEDVSAVAPFRNIVVGNFGTGINDYRYYGAEGYRTFSINQKGNNTYAGMFPSIPTFSFEMGFNFLGASAQNFRTIARSSESTSKFLIYIEPAETQLELIFKDQS